MPPTQSVRDVLHAQDLIERLAAVEHERWASWQRYVHDHCERQPDGSLVIPAELASRWEMQIETMYAELSELEKDSDREQVHRYLPVLLDALTSR